MNTQHEISVLRTRHEAEIQAAVDVRVAAIKKQYQHGLDKMAAHYQERDYQRSLEARRVIDEEVREHRVAANKAKDALAQVKRRAALDIYRVRATKAEQELAELRKSLMISGENSLESSENLEKG